MLIGGDIATINLAALTTTLAAALAVQPQRIVLTIVGGSVSIGVRVACDGSCEPISIRLTQLTTSSASDATGLQVLRISMPVVGTITVAAPSPPPPIPPPRSPPALPHPPFPPSPPRVPPPRVPPTSPALPLMPPPVPHPPLLPSSAFEGFANSTNTSADVEAVSIIPADGAEQMSMLGVVLLVAFTTAACMLLIVASCASAVFLAWRRRYRVDDIVDAAEGAPSSHIKHMVVPSTPTKRGKEGFDKNGSDEGIMAQWRTPTSLVMPPPPPPPALPTLLPPPYRSDISSWQHSPSVARLHSTCHRLPPLPPPLPNYHPHHRLAATTWHMGSAAKAQAPLPLSSTAGSCTSAGSGPSSAMPSVRTTPNASPARAVVLYDLGQPPMSTNGLDRGGSTSEVA